VSHHHLREIDIERPIAILVEVEDVGSNFANDVQQILG